MTPKIIPGSIEQRVVALSELRVVPDAPWPIEGYAALFNVLSLDLGGFQETIAAGAFARALAKPTTDVRALFNHDPNLVLGRSTAGTLLVEEDSQGMHIAIRPPDTQLGRDMPVLMKRGDVNQMSFSFTVAQDTWTQADPLMLRTVQDIEDLFDVSIVTYPAYPATRVQARGADAIAALAAAGLDSAVLIESINRSRQGQASPEDGERIEQAIAILRGYLPAEPTQAGGAADGAARLKAQANLLRRRLEIAKRR